MREHGIESFHIAQDYMLGVVVDPLPGDEGFAGMLSFPYLSRHGVKSMKFRSLDGKGPKNLVHEGTKVRLYNTNAYLNAGSVIGVAEGEADAIAATERLGVPTVGIPGAEDWKAYRRVWAPLFKNFTKVVVFTDGDPLNPITGLRPGEELGKQVAASLGWRVRLVKCPEGEDVSSMTAAGRLDELRKQFEGNEDDDDG